MRGDRSSQVEKRPQTVRMGRQRATAYKPEPIGNIPAASLPALPFPKRLNAVSLTEAGQTTEVDASEATQKRVPKLETIL